jgi:hypothetical protein
MSGEDLLNYPEIFEMIYPFLSEEKTVVDFMIAAGRKKVSAQSIFNWHEEDSLIPMIKIKTIAGTPGAGNVVTITQEALNADFEVAFKKWDILRVAGFNCWIEQDSDITVSGGDGLHSYDLTPVNNTKDVVTAATGTEGDYVVWITAAKADGTAQPTSMISKPLPYSGQIQIIPTNYTTHGSAAANKAWVQTKSGSSYFYYRGVEQAVIRHKMAVTYALLLGQESVGLVDSVHEDGATVVRTTSGLDERMRNDGNIGSNTAFSFDELQNKINKKLDELFSPEEYFALVGNQLKYQLDNIFFDRNITNSSANYGAFASLDYTYGGDPKELAVNYNFDSAKLGARTHHVRQEKALYYPQITGAPSLNFPLTGYWLPGDQIKDPKSGEWYDSMCLRYKQSDRENRFTTEWVRDFKTDDIDKFRFNHRSELGWMQARVRQTYLWEQS